MKLLIVSQTSSLDHLLCYHLYLELESIRDTVHSCKLILIKIRFTCVKELVNTGKFYATSLLSLGVGQDMNADQEIVRVQDGKSVKQRGTRMER